MIEPALSDDAFLRDVASAGADARSLHLWWLGQSGFLLQHAGRHVLLDPYLSDSLTTKYAGTDKPHVRTTRRVVDPARLDFIDIVSSSHNHTDHLDAQTLLPILDNSPQVTLIAPAANREFVAKRLGIDESRIDAIDAGETRKSGEIAFHAVPAAHEQIDRDTDGRCLYLGYVVTIGRWSIYHSGDTVWHDEIVNALAGRTIDIALLPINGHDPSRRVPGNLAGDEAARFAKTIGAKLAVPCHYEMFEFNTASPELFASTCRQIGQRYLVLRAGERLTLPAS